MTKLQTQYRNFCKENPDTELSYDQWLSTRFTYPSEPIHNLRPIRDPWIDEDVPDWDETSQSRTADIPWIDED